MALTIQGTPPDNSSIQSDLIYTVAEVAHTADPVTYPNYKFVAEVFVGGVLVATLKKVPDPVTKIGIFNVGQIVRNYITTIFNPTTNALLTQTMGDGVFSVLVQLKFGEEYAYTTYLDLEESETAIFFNNYNSKDRVSSIFFDTPLTSRPAITSIRCDSIYNFIPYVPSTTGDFVVTITAYDYANSEVDSFSQSITPVANQLYLFNVSEAGINAASPGMINDSIKYFTVEIAPDV